MVYAWTTGEIPTIHLKEAMAIKFPNAGKISLGVTAASVIAVFALPFLSGVSKTDKFLSDCTRWPGSLADCNIVLKSKEATPEQKERATAKAETLRANKEQEDASLAKKRAAEAKFKAEGWWEEKPGVYVRWCTQTCSKAEVIGNQSYWLMEVWAKDRAAGDIYAQINVLEGGTVIGWTNDTAYLSKGQKGVLTFAKYLPGYGSQYQAELVKFSARG